MNSEDRIQRILEDLRNKPDSVLLRIGVPTNPDGQFIRIHPRKLLRLLADGIELGEVGK